MDKKNNNLIHTSYFANCSNIMAVNLKIRLHYPSHGALSDGTPQASRGRHRHTQSLDASPVISAEKSPVRDITRPNFYFLSEKENEEIYINDLTRSLSSKALA